MEGFQLDLFSVVADIYASHTEQRITNDELYKFVAEKAGINEDTINKKSPIGKSQAMHSEFKRKVRWHQQTLKSMGLIERIDGEKGVWQYVDNQGKELHKAKTGVKILAFSTDLGVAIWGSNRDVFSSINEPIALCVTSPPYPLKTARKYGNPQINEYIDFILQSLEPVVKSLMAGGSIVINVGNDIFLSGNPARSLYREKLVIAICEELGLYKMDEIPWVNYSKGAYPTEWACKKPFQLATTYEPIYWFTNDPYKIRANNREVLQPHTEKHKKVMANGGEHRIATYGDGAYKLRENSFSRTTEGKLPRNVIERGHMCADSNLIRKAAKELGLPTHAAMFPTSLADFFIRFLSKPNDLVVDLFSGSGKVGIAAERLNRRWIMTEIILEYARVSAELFRGAAGFQLSPVLANVWR